MTHGTHLRGLEGTNPAAFQAAVGTQVLFVHERRQPDLWWTDDVVPHAVVAPEFDVDSLVDKALAVFPRWLASPAADPRLGTGADNSAKFTPEDLREYLRRAGTGRPGNRLATALVAEGSLDSAGNAKPSDLYFAAGQLRFLKVVRAILTAVDRQALKEALEGPWTYSSKLSSLGWDITDDRIYALSATNPAEDKNRMNPGVEALAILGLSRHPVFAGRDHNGRNRTLTRGCAGPWKRGCTYTWPIWTRPASPAAVRSLLAHTTSDPEELARRSRWYPAWGISSVFRSVIHRSDRGGYGTFRPPQIVWSRE